MWSPFFKFCLFIFGFSLTYSLHVLFLKPFVFLNGLAWEWTFENISWRLLRLEKAYVVLILCSVQWESCFHFRFISLVPWWVVVLNLTFMVSYFIFIYLFFNSNSYNIWAVFCKLFLFCLFCGLYTCVETLYGCKILKRQKPWVKYHVNKCFFFSHIFFTNFLLIKCEKHTGTFLTYEGTSWPGPHMNISPAVLCVASYSNGNKGECSCPAGTRTRTCCGTILGIWPLQRVLEQSWPGPAVANL